MGGQDDQGGEQTDSCLAEIAKKPETEKQSVGLIHKQSVT